MSFVARGSPCSELARLPPTKYEPFAASIGPCIPHGIRPDLFDDGGRERRVRLAEGRAEHDSRVDVAPRHFRGRVPSGREQPLLRSAGNCPVHEARAAKTGSDSGRSFNARSETDSGTRCQTRPSLASS